MPCALPYWKAVAIAHDQLVNAWLRGWPDETLSSRAYRLSASGKPTGRAELSTLSFSGIVRAPGAIAN